MDNHELFARPILGESYGPVVLVRSPLSDGRNFVGDRQTAMRCGVQTLSYGWIVFMLAVVAAYVNYQMYVA